MFAISEKISRLLTCIVYNTTKSKRTFTPLLFANPRLTPHGIFKKPQRSYNYQLPESLPNRHLYWDRKVENKKLRLRYNQRKMQKLKINPIHDKQGKRTYQRDCDQIIAQLTSIQVIRQSVGRTMTNIHECLVRFPERFLNNGPDADVFSFVFKQLHDRHLPTMSFYVFSNFCHLRHRAKLPPTQPIMLHFYKFLQASTHNKNQKLTIERLGTLSSYIFSINYPECQNLVHKKKIDFELFAQGQQTFKTFGDILSKLYSKQYINQVRERLKNKDKQVEKSLKGVMKIPGGHKLVESISSSN